MVVSIGFGDSAHQFHAALRCQGRARALASPWGPGAGRALGFVALGISAVAYLRYIIIGISISIAATLTFSLPPTLLQ